MIIIRFITKGGQLMMPLADDKKPQQVFAKIRKSIKKIISLEEFSREPDRPVIINKKNLCFALCEVKSEIATPAKKIQTPGNLGIN